MRNGVVQSEKDMGRRRCPTPWMAVLFASARAGAAELPAAIAILNCRNGGEGSDSLPGWSRPFRVQPADFTASRRFGYTRVDVCSFGSISTVAHLSRMWRQKWVRTVTGAYWRVKTYWGAAVARRAFLESKSSASANFATSANSYSSNYFVRPATAATSNTPADCVAGLH